MEETTTDEVEEVEETEEPEDSSEKQRYEVMITTVDGDITTFSPSWTHNQYQQFLNSITPKEEDHAVAVTSSDTGSLRLIYVRHIVRVDIKY